LGWASGPGAEVDRESWTADEFASSPLVSKQKRPDSVSGEIEEDEVRILKFIHTQRR
jgi:hypothetical protein